MSPTGYIGIKYEVELQACPHSVLSPLGLEETSLHFVIVIGALMPGSTDFNCCSKSPNDSAQVIPLEPLVSYQFVTLASWKGVDSSLYFLSFDLLFFTV